MPFLHPNYEVKIQGETKAEPSSNVLLQLIVDLHLDTPADSARLLLRPADWTGDLERDDPVTISLGYEDDLKPVFSGSVVSSERNLSSVRLYLLGGALKLLDLRVNEIYSDQDAGDIVSDLASKAGLQVDDVESGISFPNYFVDNSRNAYDHIKELAERCAFDVYLTPENALVFKKYDPENTHTLEYGKNIISIEGSFEESPYDSVKAYGESPSSTKGSDTANWLTTDDVTGEAGSGNQLEIFDPAIRDTDTAEKVAQAKLKALSYAKFFNLKVVGSPEIRLGDGVEIKSMPDDLLNGKFKVTRVEHILSKNAGFTTKVECEGVEDE